MTSPHGASPERVRDEAVQWVTRLHSGDCSEAERRAFAAWLAKSESHRAAYREVEGFWEGLGGLKTLAGPELCRVLRGPKRPLGERCAL